MISKEAIVQIISSTVKLDFPQASIELAAQKIMDLANSDGSTVLKCTCYSTSFCSEGIYVLVRHDCPVHKGSLDGKGQTHITPFVHKAEYSRQLPSTKRNESVIETIRDLMKTRWEDGQNHDPQIAQTFETMKIFTESQLVETIIDLIHQVDQLRP
jgi:hypothetical protein